MNCALRLGFSAILVLAIVLTSVHSSFALGPVEDALQQNTADCADGIGLSFTDREFDEALALGGQDEDEFKSSRYACGTRSADGRTELAQCTEPRTFGSFSAAGVAPDGWVVCLVAMLIAENGRGYRASLENYEAVLANGEVARPDRIVSSWAGNHSVFSADITIEQIISADSLGYGLLAFPEMPDDDFVLRNRETGNRFLISKRENVIGDLLPFVAAPGVDPIVMSGTGYGSSLWIMSLGEPLRVTLDITEVGEIVSLDAEYRRDGSSILPDTESVMDLTSRFSEPEYFSACPPCDFSRTVEFFPETGKIFHFSVLADGNWTITVEAIGSEAVATNVPPVTSTPTTWTNDQVPTETPIVPLTWTPTPTSPPPYTPTPTPLIIVTPTPTHIPTFTPVPPPTYTPSPTLTPPLVERTPTPTTEASTEDELLDLLPNEPPLDHASCFNIVDDGTLSFEQLLERFPGVQDAEARLQEWKWQSSAFRQFGCGGPAEGNAGWIDIGLHLFGTPQAAQEAVDYFAAVRLEGAPLVSGGSPGIGDHSTALSGPAWNGNEFTIYASDGPLLIRVTGVAPSGIPFGNVLAVAQAVLAAQNDTQPQSPETSAPLVPAFAYLPSAPAVNYAECFSVLADGTYDYGDVVDALLRAGSSQSEFDGVGWRDGAYRVFTCSNPPLGRATQIDVVVHQFWDGSAAQQALPYVRRFYTPRENEVWQCDTAGQLVACIVGRSLTGSPLSDVAFVLQQVVATAGS